MTKIEDVILFQIDMTSKVSKQYAQKEFDKIGLGITIEQWIILKIISESPPLSQKELAEKSYRDPASITRTLDLLEKKKLLRRETIPTNRRTYVISLTKEGKQFINQHLPMVTAHRNKSIEGIGEADLKKLSLLLQKIRHNMA